MKRLTVPALLAVLLLGALGIARAETQVRVTGDSRVYGVYFSGHNFTGWNDPAWTSNTPTWTKAGTKTEDTFEIWERIRVRTDFIANDNLKFRLATKVDNTWGNGTYTAANPDVAIQVYQAFLEFKYPDTDIQINAGLQPTALPQSALFNDSIVFTDWAAALIVKAPLIANTLELNAGFARMIDTNRTFDPSTTQVGDELDFYILSLPITVPGLKATPWGVVGVAGAKAGYYTAYASSFAEGSYAEDLLSAGTLVGPTGWKNNQNPYYWVGGAFELSALDPVRFYADVINGGGAMNDRNKSRRQGWFVDFGAEYTGFDMLTPQVFAWWSTGEDGSTRNGSERMPHTRPNWGPGGSFLFDDSQVFARNSNMGMDPVGAMGLGLSLNNVTFMDKLSQRATFTYLKGNNAPRAIRDLNAALGSNPYFQMGRDLTTNEYALGVNFDSQYMIYENLAARVETGFAHGQFQESVWGHRLANKANGNDTWKVAFGFTYKY
ncbi:MAG: outer membrane homotrimeric porin [Solidesulfovibrio sp.]|uniref:outer membrane homotrimeric porin n=1 Tax=Solidesulfovibrio sp. TaxID=2910990 RepID=UPI002B1FB502|nr:outer membrane homotrimeric porin [Solidesulfovibrio sp.]MEA4856021.1 outer membrane homotrimeric porin [Solidesulfovibrio sp.]